jgi:hypothetical protein
MLSHSSYGSCYWQSNHVVIVVVSCNMQILCLHLVEAIFFLMAGWIGRAFDA